MFLAVDIYNNWESEQQIDNTKNLGQKTSVNIFFFMPTGLKTKHRAVTEPNNFPVFVLFVAYRFFDTKKNPYVVTRYLLAYSVSDQIKNAL